MGPAAPHIIPVSSVDEQGLEPYRNLRDADLARLDAGGGVPSESTSGGSFIAEGELVVRQLIGSRLYRPASLLVSEGRLGAIRDAIEDLPAGVPVFVAPQDVMDAIVGYPIHRGVLAAGTRPAPLSPAELIGRSSTLLVLEGLGNHDNVGAMFRVGAALAGSSLGVLLDPTSCDPLYRKSIRVSMGHVLHTPFARTPDLPDSLASLRGAGWRTVAMVTDQDAEPASPQIASGPEDKLAVVLGSEGHGLTDEASRACAERVRIRMTPGVDSLNVFVAAAIALHSLRPLETPL